MKASIYFLFGEEDFLIDERLAQLTAGVNTETFEGGRVTPGEIYSAVNTISMFAPEKTVVIRDTVPSDELLTPLKNIPAGVTVILTAPGLDKRTKFYKFINEHADVEEFKTFAPWEQQELQRWISARVKLAGKTISEGVARRLSEICGNNLRLLVSEVEKLVTYIGDRAGINEADVDALATPGEISVFALLDALRVKNLKEALMIFQTLLRNKEELNQLLGLLATQYRLLLQLKTLAGKEKDIYKLSRLAGGSPFFVKKCLEDINRFSLDDLKHNIGALLETSLKLKTGENQTVVFELLLTSLCNN